MKKILVVASIALGLAGCQTVAQNVGVGAAAGVIGGSLLCGPAAAACAVGGIAASSAATGAIVGGVVGGVGVAVTSTKR